MSNILAAFQLCSDAGRTLLSLDDIMKQIFWCLIDDYQGTLLNCRKVCVAWGSSAEKAAFYKKWIEGDEEFGDRSNSDEGEDLKRIANYVRVLCVEGTGIPFIGDKHDEFVNKVVNNLNSLPRIHSVVFANVDFGTRLWTRIDTAGKVRTLIFQDCTYSPATFASLFPRFPDAYVIEFTKLGLHFVLADDLEWTVTKYDADRAPDNICSPYELLIYAYPDTGLDTEFVEFITTPAPDTDRLIFSLHRVQRLGWLVDDFDRNSFELFGAVNPDLTELEIKISGLAEISVNCFKKLTRLEIRFEELDAFDVVTFFHSLSTQLPLKEIRLHCHSNGVGGMDMVFLQVLNQASVIDRLETVTGVVFGLFKGDEGTWRRAGTKRGVKYDFSSI